MKGAAIALCLVVCGPLTARGQEPAPPAPVLTARPVARKPPPRWYKDWLAPLLVLGGVVCIAGSALNYDDERAAYDARNVDYVHYLAARDSPAHLIADSVFLGVGAALIVGAAVRWTVLGVRERRALAVGARF